MLDCDRLNPQTVTSLSHERAAASHRRVLTPTSMAFQIHFSQPLNAELSRVIAEQFDFALACLDRVSGDPLSGGASEDAIHEFRKTTKKLRALIRMLRSALPKAVAKQWLASLSSAAAALSLNRDAQVLEHHLQRAYQALVPDGAMEARPWRNLTLFEPYRNGLSKASEVASVEVARAELLALRAELEEGLFATVTLSELLRGQTQCYRRARQLLKVLRTPVPMEPMHHFRKRAKDNLYQLRLLKRLSPKRLKVELDQLDELAVALGELNDLNLLLLAHDAAQAGGGAPVELPGLKEWILAGIAELESRALGLAEPLYSQSPKKHGQKLRAYHRAFVRAQHRRACDLATATLAKTEAASAPPPKSRASRCGKSVSHSDVCDRMSP